MRRVVLKMSISLDGFVAGPNGEIDWIFKSSVEASRAWLAHKIGQAGAHLMGSKTFREMAGFWPTAQGPFATPMNEIPKIVFSKQGLNPLEFANGKSTVASPPKSALAKSPESSQTWSDALVLNGDLAEEITRLKEQSGKDLVAHGGATFAQNLVRTGLVDEFWMVVHPVALGRGLPLFSKLDGALDLRLKESRFFESGVVANVYNVLRK